MTNAAGPSYFVRCSPSHLLLSVWLSILSTIMLENELIWYDNPATLLTGPLQSVFGSSFSTHGLGAVLTCGVIGIKAGLSHSPVMGDKEQVRTFSV